MIDLDNLINTDRSRAELEAWLLFCVTTAAASAEKQADKFNALLGVLDSKTPFEGVRSAMRRGDLHALLANSKLGKYARLSRAFTECLSLDPATCTLDQLECVFGIGRKTARLFVLYSRPHQRCAALDVHILRHLRDQFPAANVPESTPMSGREYARLEALFLRLADRAEVSAVDYDQRVWNSLRRRGVIGGHGGRHLGTGGDARAW